MFYGRFTASSCGREDVETGYRASMEVGNGWEHTGASNFDYHTPLCATAYAGLAHGGVARVLEA